MTNFDLFTSRAERDLGMQRAAFKAGRWFVLKPPAIAALSIVIAICVVITAPQSASAQCTYRMNDVGRPHGYLSGPCNGAASNLAGAYPTPAARTPVPAKANKRVNRRASSR